MDKEIAERTHSFRYAPLNPHCPDALYHNVLIFTFKNFTRRIEECLDCREIISIKDTPNNTNEDSPL